MSDTPIRVQRKRTKGFKLPENTVCVTRGTNWGNPFRVGDHPSYSHLIIAFGDAHKAYALKDITLTLEKAVEYHALYCRNETREYWIKQTLRGKNLACWCALDKPCHADVLLKIANE